MNAYRPIILCLLLAVFTGVACSQKKLSDQELRRQQELLTGDRIRAELQKVEGIYEGDIQSTAGLNQPIRLTLSLRDVPVVVEGSPEPVLTPKLVGSLRVIYNEAKSEYIDAPIKAAEYFSTRATLNVVVTHSNFGGDLTINYVVKDSELTGNWSASAVGASGTSVVRRK